MRSYVAENLARLVPFKWAGVLLFVVGLLGTSFVVVADPEGMPRRYWARYVAYLERKLRLMFIWTPGSAIAIGQVLGLAAILVGYVLFDLPYAYGWVVLVVAGPPAYIEYMRRKRVEQIENQIDMLIMALANALKSTPSLGDAFGSVARLLPPPIKDEVELAVKEMRVGSTLEQAVLFMAGRIGSRIVDSALSAVLIGRQVGGNLPKILETTAGSLREMARLEGVVRTKTAEGKAQLWVLALFPVVFVYLLGSVKQGYFDPLLQGWAGYTILAAALAMWIASLLLARKILRVDI